MTDASACIVCGSATRPVGREYRTAELFELWQPIRFSRETIAEHEAQAPATRLYRCVSCGLERFSPPLIGTPSFYVEAYNLNQTQADSTFTYSRDKWEFEEGLKEAARCRRAFEFGCAEGEFLARMKARGVEVAGTEYNPAALESARRKGLTVFDTAAALPPTQRQGWDGVFSFHVLEHAADPVQFVREMADMVRPDGVIVLCVPNQDGPIAFIDPCVMNMPPHHATRWRLTSFEALAKRLGLAIERVAYEPLLLENHSYYSVHAVRTLINGSWPGAALARIAISLPLRLAFGTLRRLGIRYWSMLKGQSIYVVLRKA